MKSATGCSEHPVGYRRHVSAEETTTELLVLPAATMRVRQAHQASPVVQTTAVLALPVLLRWATMPVLRVVLRVQPVALAVLRVRCWVPNHSSQG